MDSREFCSIRAPLLEATLQELDPDSRIFITDLGGLRADTLNVFSAYRCRLDILDLNLDAIRADAQVDSFPAAIKRVEQGFPDQRGEYCDLLLCWNFMNYFSIEELVSLMTALVRRLTPNGRIHALIESSAQQMSALPLALSLGPQGEVRWPDSRACGAMIGAPRHTNDGLMASLPGFGVEKTLLLANGQKEYLFFRR